MESRTKLLGHPIHPVLVVFPLGLLTASVAFDVIDRFRDSGSWAQTASATMAAGVLGGLAAAPFGLRDWLAIPAGTRAKRVGLWHAGANVIALVLFAVSWSLRRDDPTTAALIVTSLGFRLYVTSFGNYSATYGSIGAVIVLMLWFYLAGLVMLVGAEIDAISEARAAAIPSGAVTAA